jgi:hypothetical protein
MASPVGFLNASAANALGPRTKSKAAASVGGLLHVVDVVHVAYWPSETCAPSRMSASRQYLPAGGWSFAIPPFCTNGCAAILGSYAHRRLRPSIRDKRYHYFDQGPRYERKENHSSTLR